MHQYESRLIKTIMSRGWVMPHQSEAYLMKTSHVTRVSQVSFEWVMSREWVMSYKWVMSHQIKSWVTKGIGRLVVHAHVNASCRIRARHLSSKRVISWKRTRHITCMSHVPLEESCPRRGVMSQKKDRATGRCCCAYEYVMSHQNESREIRTNHVLTERAMSREWVMST